MKRSIVKQGPSTLMVSLPAKWARNYQLTKGDQVEVTENGRELIIATDQPQETRRKHIDLLSDHQYYIWREIVAAYISGYDEIEVMYKHASTFNHIEERLLQFLTGSEIVEQKGNTCVLKQIVIEEREQFDVIAQRLFAGLLRTSEIFTTVLATGKDGTLFVLERANNRQAYYLLRLLTKEGYVFPEKTMFAFTMVDLLEGVLNQYKYCAWAIERQQIRPNKNVQDIYARVHEKIEKLCALYTHYSQKEFEEFMTSTIKVNSHTGETIDSIHEEPVTMHYLIAIIDKLNDLAYQIHGLNS